MSKKNKRKLKDKETPLRLVRKISKENKNCYEALDIISNLPGMQPNTPASFKNPPSKNLCRLLYNGEDLSHAQSYADYEDKILRIETCWLWRKYKPIYYFDPDLTELLVEQGKASGSTGRLPTDILLQPSYPSIYVKAPAIYKETDGFFYWTDFDDKDKHPILRIVWLGKDMETTDTSCFLPIVPGARINDCTNIMFNDVMDLFLHFKDDFPGVDEHTLRKYVRETVSKSVDKALTALQFILYLASQNADVTEEPVVRTATRSYHSRRAIEDRASEVSSHAVGIRVGAAIRKHKSYRYQSGNRGTGASKCPHIRQGHWHHYWTGPRDGERRLVLKWLAPTFINMDSDKLDDHSATVYPVSA